METLTAVAKQEPEVLTPSGEKPFAERMRILKQIANVTGVRLPATIIPEGESLIPYGVQRQRALEDDIYSLPTLAEGINTLRDIRKEQHPKDVRVAIQRLRMSPVNGGFYGEGHEDAKPMGYSETGFNQASGFVKPSNVYGSITPTLLALPPAIRAEAFNHFAKSNTENKHLVLRTQLVPARQLGATILRRSVSAVVSDIYTGVEDYSLVEMINSALPDGARLRYTQTEERSDLEILWPAMKRELKVGDLALIAIQITNSQVKKAAIRITPKVLRVLCLNFTTAWGEGADSEVSIRHVGEAKRKFAEAIRKAIDTVAPFVVAFGDAYSNRLPVFAPTRGEVIGKFIKAYDLSEKQGPRIAESWDADGEKSAGDTLAGLANAVTRASQVLTIEAAEPFEKAAGRIVMEGWAALED